MLRWGIEPICEVLQIAPSSYYARKTRPASRRRLRDQQLKAEILRVFDQNLAAYGADKIWTQLNREGIRVARCAVERLMGDLGVFGVRRGRGYKVTTHSDSRQHRPDDLVDRVFRAPGGRTGSGSPTSPT